MINELIPAGLTGKALFDFVVKNESKILHAKKTQIKKADCFISTSALIINEKGELVQKKAGSPTVINENELNLSVVINTTNWFDSHMDVHIPKLWNRSIQNNKKGFYLLNSHKQTWDGVIGEELKAKSIKTNFKDLGFDIDFNCEALTFIGKIYKDDNPYMFDKYKRKKVKQHSVGMQYVSIKTCINYNEIEYENYKANWDKYIEQVANKDEAEQQGVFWAVLEAKIIEGSAVLFGSNVMTPDISGEEKEFSTNDNIDGSENPTHPKQPENSTAEKSFMDFIKETKFINI